MAGVIAALATAAVGWASGDGQSAVESGLPQPRSIDPPAFLGSTSPTIHSEGATTVVRGHDILMTWLEPTESGRRLRFARYSLGEWFEPITVAEQVTLLAPEDRPSLTVIDTQAVRRTLIARCGDIIARSGDAGRTWGRLPSAPLPFASFAGGEEGAYAFWLSTGEDGAKLLGTRVLAGESLLDPRVSGGSSTAAAMTWDGPVVAYRDSGAQGAQDIALVRRHEARWTPSRPIHVGGWRPDHTPKSGPRIAALRRDVAVAWYTEAAHRPRLLVAFSGDAGRSFSAPVEVDAKDEGHAPLEAVDVTLDDDGQALVLWMTADASPQATLRLARVSPDRGRAREIILAEGLSTGWENAPQITRAGPRVAVTWVEGVPERVRTVTVPLAGIPGLESSRSDTAVADEEGPGLHVDRGRVGDSIPDLELTDLEGGEVDLAALRGHPVLVNLWATWCLPCIAEMPELAALYERYGKEGLKMVGVTVDEADALDKVHAFVAEHQVPFAVWLDPQMILYTSLRVRTLPVTLLVDREGVIVLRRDGRIRSDDPELEEALSRVLGDS